jgi:glycerate kinase
VRIVIAMDKFKGSLSAPRACEIVRDGIRAVRPEAGIVLKPMADGGDGTAGVLLAALGGRWIARRVTGPLPGRHVTARYAWLSTGATAVVEMAAASGLALLTPRQRNPLKTTTAGTGQLIADALRRGARRILLGVGGSATVDGGVGMARVLGWKFLDAGGRPVGPGGGELNRIARIIPPAICHPPSARIEVLCDVDNALCGQQGAARVFGPQKGATAAMVGRLDAGLRHLARLVKEQLDKQILNVPGAGAAGGLAAGALAFLDARLARGVDVVMDLCRLRQSMQDADWVITGEGKLDRQSLRGKVVSGVTKLAREAGAKAVVIAGRVEISRKLYRRAGIELAIPTMRPSMPLEQAMRRADTLLLDTAAQFAQEHLLSARGSSVKLGGRRPC